MKINTSNSFSFSIRPKTLSTSGKEADEKSNSVNVTIGLNASNGLNASTSTSTAEDKSGVIRLSAKPLVDFSQIQKSASESKKSAARQRMAQLKSQLEAMMKFSMFDVNPRLIAQLAKELKSLVAQYGDAGMSVAVPSTAGAESGAEGAEAAEAADSAATAAASGSESDEATKNPDGSEKVSGAEATTDTNAATEASLTASEKEKTAEEKAAEKDSAEKTAAASTTEDAVAAAAAQAAATAQAAANAAETVGPNLTKTDGVIKQILSNQGDREFFAEAKKLAQMLKYLMSRKKPPANEKSQEAKDINAAKKAIEDLDKSITKVEEAFFAPSEVDSVTAAYSGGDVQISLGLSVFV